MTSFNIRPDDVGTRNLRNENLKPHSTKQVGAVTPYPEVHPAKIGFHEAVERDVRALSRQPGQQAEQELIVAEPKERQKQDRRRHQEPVLLDTRSGSERRLLENNPHAELLEEEEHIGLGIDLYT